MSRLVAVQLVLLLVPLAVGCSESVAPADGSMAPDAGRPDLVRDAGVDAGPTLERCVPGAQRYVECGACGSASQRCLPDGTWDALEACAGEGECVPGSEEVETTVMCGSRRRTCEIACRWRDWTELVPDGVCVPGTMRDVVDMCGPNEAGRQSCQDDCQWSATECFDPCGAERRATPADAEELCIPEGPFNRGVTPRDDRLFPGASPMAEVFVSAYYMDRYPVTNERYQRCVDDGACPPLLGSVGAAAIADSTRSRDPVQEVPKASAEAFCAWDGGRRLPTEAEWEKAARGPLPREVLYPWGDDPECFPYIRCGSGWSSDVLEPIDGFPMSASYYGVERLVGAGVQWVSDLYDEYYYASAASRIDPMGPATGRSLRRGWLANDERGGTSSGRFRVYFRYHYSLPFQELTTFRCARAGR